MNIKLDRSKLLGFRICDEAEDVFGSKIGVKLGQKTGTKLGRKMGAKLGRKIGIKGAITL